MPPDSVGGFPPYYVRVIFLNVVIAWPYVARFCVLRIFGEVSGNNGATQCPWLGMKYQLRNTCGVRLSRLLAQIREISKSCHLRCFSYDESVIRDLAALFVHL